MKRLTNGLALAGLLLAAACSSSSDTHYNGTYTLQGVIADAVTGSRVGGGDLQVFLVQGSEVRGPTRLISDAGDPLLGEYAFAGIPNSLYNNVTYKVVVLKPGYERFESEINFDAYGAGGNLVDDHYNYIGNVYLFPVGASAPSYSFTLTYNGKPVPGATVLLDPVSQSSPTFNTGSALSASTGYVESLQATSGADGVATFAGSALALGVAYNVAVLPVAFKDTTGTSVQLARYKATTNLVAGLANAQQLVSLSDLTATDNTVYIASASNRPQDQIRTGGELVITFNAPVALVNPNGFGATFTVGTDAAGTAAGAGVLSTTQPVNASLSPDGLTLTLSPNFTTPPADTDRNVSITYGDGTATVSPRDYPATQLSVFGLKYADNLTPLSGAVVLRAP